MTRRQDENDEVDPIAAQQAAALEIQRLRRLGGIYDHRHADDINRGERDAIAAKLSASDELGKVESRWPEILRRVAPLRVQRMDNHFAERLHRALLGER